MAAKHKKEEEETAARKNGSGGGLQRSYFDVLGICCASEISVIENILKPLEGVKEVTVIVTTRTVIVVHDNLLISQSQIVKVLNQARLEANVRAYGEHKNHRKKWPSPYSAASGLLLLLSLLKFVNPIFQWLAVAAVAVGIWPIAFKSFAAIRNFRIDINILALIAVVGTIAMKDYLEAATIVFLFSIAEWLESRASHKANAVMSSLLSIAPQKAVLADSGEVVATDEVKLGSLLAVKPGEVIPIDGIVVEGKCEVDEKTLTGESFPVAKQKNSIVWAGTINLNGYVTVKTTVLSQDCVVAKMAKLVEDAQSNKSRIQRFIDKCAKYYTPAVLIISTCIAVIPAALRLQNRKLWFHLALVVLVSACPCALILSTPVATFCALTKAATSGLLIKGGDYLETLARIKVMAFDKTGTITRGEFTVTKFQALDQINISLNTLLYWVSSIESKSSHPMATALVDHGRSLSIDPKPENVDDFQNFPGEGVHGKIDGKDIYIGNRKIAIRANCTTVPEIKDDAQDGRTVGYIFCGATPAGIFSLSDTCRRGAKEAMEELQSLGIKTAMLTGDCSASALQAQKELGKALQIVHAELLPEDKTRLINDFKREGRTAMIGDGLNDAPALATADIGISMGISGSALAIETGDVILMSNDIRKIPKVIQLARRARMKVIENVILAITPRIAILGLAFAGHPLVWAAVLADVGTCVLVILNSMLLLRGTGKHTGKAGKSAATECTYKRECCNVNSNFDQHDNYVLNLESAVDGFHSSNHLVHEDCCASKKIQEGSLSHNCASKCCSRTTNSSSCKKIKSVESTSKQDDSAGCVKLNERGCCINNNQSAQRDRHTYSSSTDHQIKDNCCSQQNIPEFCLPQKCASKCQSKTSISSSCEEIKCTKSTLMLDGSTGSAELYESGCCTRSSQSVQLDHHIIQIPDANASNSHSCSPGHHIRNDCCSQENTQNISLPRSQCQSKTCNSSSCQKTKCGDSTVRQDECTGSVELQDQKNCNIGRFDTSDFDLESQGKLNNNSIGPCASVSLCTKDNCCDKSAKIGERAKDDGCQEVKPRLCNAACCEENGGSNRDDGEGNLKLPQSKCQSKTCNSSSCGKTKCGDSMVRQEECTGSLELQDQNHCNLRRFNTSNFDLESLNKNFIGPCRSVSLCTEDKCCDKGAKTGELAKADGCQEVKLRPCNATCCEKNGGSNSNDDKDYLNLPESKCQSKTSNSSSCGEFTLRQGQGIGSLKLQDQNYCNLGRFDTSDFDLDSQEKLNNNFIGPCRPVSLCTEDKCCDKGAKIGKHGKADGCREGKLRPCNATCCENNGESNRDGGEDLLNLPQSKCQSKTCNSSSCTDSAVRQDECIGSLELQNQKHCNLGRFDTSDFDLESKEKLNNNCRPCRAVSCTEDKCSNKVAKIGDHADADGCQEVKLGLCNATCCEKKRNDRDGDEHHSNLQHEGVQHDLKACHGDFGGAFHTSEAMEKRETINGCKSCKKEWPELKIGQSCAGLEKREVGGCCKSYMKECCRKKHGDIGTTVGGGLNEIIIDY